MFSQLTQQAHCIDELTALQFGWDFTASQLAPSAAASSVELYQTANVGYNRFHLNTAIDQKLYVREGFVSIGLLEPDNPTTWLHDQVIPNEGLVVFPRDDNLKAVSPAGFRGNGVHFLTTFLGPLAEQVYQLPLERLLPPAGIYIPEKPRLMALRGELGKWQQVNAQGAGTCKAVVSRREQGLAMAILDALVDAKPGHRVSVRKSTRAMARALEYIHDNDLAGISAVELSRYADCSQRTLENSFQQRFGVTPKKYIKCLRLAGVHRGLRGIDDNGCESIIELAGIHGFWHMGQFAADYRRLYRELPSETVFPSLACR